MKTKIKATSNMTLRYALTQQLYYSISFKVATDPKNFISDPAGSYPDPDPLTQGTFFSLVKRYSNILVHNFWLNSFVSKKVEKKTAQT